MYPTRYNFAMKQYNATAITGITRKKQMRGGRFLMYRFVTILAFFIALTSGGISSILKALIEDNSKWKSLVTLNIVTSFYLSITLSHSNGMVVYFMIV